MRKNKEHNLLALACAFIIACKAYKVNEQDAVTAATNLMVDRVRSERIGHGFAAMEQHLKEDYT